MHAELKVEHGINQGAAFVIRIGQRFVIGRSGASVLLPGDAAVSRRHAQVELRSDGSLTIADLNSRNGTYIDGQPVDPYKPQVVRDGVQILVGGHVLRATLHSPADEDTRRVSRPPNTYGIGDQDLEILGLLGQGSHGSVFSAYQRLMDRRVALKVLLLDSQEELLRFIREARLACRVRSPYVVEVYDVRRVGGRILMLMELVDGTTLLDRLGRGRPLSIPGALSIAEHVARGLAAIHLEGVVHRDIKPSNILISPAGVAKLSDFGIAKDLRREDEELTPGEVGLGSVPYISPEQITVGATLDTRADIYGLGATLYHAIAGRPPFPVEGPDIIRRVVEDTPPLLTSLNPFCPPDVARLVAGMMEKNPDARPANAESAARQIGELRQLLFPDYSTSDRRQMAAGITQTQRTAAVPRHLLNPDQAPSDPPPVSAEEAEAPPPPPPGWGDGARNESE